MTTRQYKNLKGLKKESLRDNMSTLELALNMVAEAATTEISKQTKPEGFEANKAVAIAGGFAAKAAKVSIEETTGKPIVTSKKAAELNHMVTAMNENTKPNEDIEIKDEELELKDDELDGVSGGVNANAMLTPNLAGPITRD